jgi:hypothetical protein
MTYVPVTEFEFGDKVTVSVPGSDIPFAGVVVKTISRELQGLPPTYVVLSKNGLWRCHTADSLKPIDPPATAHAPANAYGPHFDELLNALMKAHAAFIDEQYRHVERVYDNAADAFCQYVAEVRANGNAMAEEPSNDVKAKIK